MNPIQKAIADIKFKIPQDILMATFTYREFGMRAPLINLDTMIRQHVIEAKVKVDCDLVGGIEVEVPIGGVLPEYLDYSTMVYRIPKSLTQNRSISRVLAVTMGSGLMAGTAMVGSTTHSHMLGAVEGVMAAVSPIPIVSTAYIRLIAENTILVTDQIRFPGTAFLRCYLENDADFSHLRSTTYHKFAKLVELATKAYIFNELAIPVARAELVGGQDLGRFKEILDGYADAAELYDTFLEETWRKVAIMDDRMSHERHLRMLLARW